MSRARHKKHHRESGGAVSWKGGNQNVIREAEERKRGGRIHHGEGEEAKAHAGKRARGGAVPAKKVGGAIMVGAGRSKGGAVPAKKDGGTVTGKATGGAVVPKRARGGAVGADKRPLSSAAVIKKLPEERGGDTGAGPASQ